LALAPRVRVTIGMLAGIAVFAAGSVTWRACATDSRLRAALSRRGVVAVWGDTRLAKLGVEGTQLVRADMVPALADALRSRDEDRVVAALRASRIDAVLVPSVVAAEAGQGSVLLRLARYHHVSGLRGIHLAREGMLAAPEPDAPLGVREREAVAAVARGLLGGADPPSVASFPPPLRSLRPVEVMVLLRSGGRARLWRSARGSSIARALITAATVARKRWSEREQAMGGPIDRALPRLDVEVSLLEDDGTLGDRDPDFIDRAFGEDHGVAYEYKGAWRYLLPAATRERGSGRASVAYRALFTDDGLPPESLANAALRLYRLKVHDLARSLAAPAPKDAVSDVQDPAEVIGR
jgi:hypothetical protein